MVRNSSNKARAIDAYNLRLRGLTYREIAARMGLPESTVAFHIRYGAAQSEAVGHPAAKLSTRTLNCLRHAELHGTHIRTVADVRWASDEELLRIPKFGRGCLAELRDAVVGWGDCTALVPEHGASEPELPRQERISTAETNVAKVLLSHEDLLARGISYCKDHLRRLEVAGKFPGRVKIGAQRCAWPAAEVDAWIKSRVTARDEAPKSTIHTVHHTAALGTEVNLTWLRSN